MNKKRLRIAIPVLLLFLTILSVYQYSKKSFDNLLGTNETNITKVFMRSGVNGDYVETEDKEKIKEIISLLNDRYYKKSFNQSLRTGYSYFYDFYSGNKHLIRRTGSENNVEVNSTYYNVSKPISTKSLTDWFNSLPVHPFK